MNTLKDEDMNADKKVSSGDVKKEEDLSGKQNDQTKNKPDARRVDDENNLEEKDLKRSFLFGEGKMKSTTDPGMEGQGMGGQNFGENNLTLAGNDPANPPQNAGEDNAYFKRTQPAEEHPENENFKPDEIPDFQKGTADDNGPAVP